MPVIDIETESVEPVAELCRKRLGRRVSSGTRSRWIRHGVAGVKLAAVSVGGVWCTTPAAFAEFIRAQTDSRLEDRASLLEEPAHA
ncbi:MAG: DUF1580 domain-containing protein [Planctomycetaceae bacterium]|nr:DUF1580 domain-containing protein [Planctomycetaceae bacterium]